MTLQTAAEHLLSQIDLPPGSANVLPFFTSEGGRLVIWVEHRYLHWARSLPEWYEGYPVSIEERPSITQQ